MRINHFITTISRGGAENQLLILCREQIASGHEVSVTPLKGQLELLDEFESENIRVDLSFHGKNFLLQVIRKTVTNWKKNEIQHAHLPQAELLLAMSLQREYFSTRHYGSAFFPGKSLHLSRLLSRLAAKRATKIIAISRFVAEYLVESREIGDNNKIIIVQYGFDASKFPSSFQQSSPPEPPFHNPLRVGTLARLSPEKDLTTLIRGFSIFCNSTARLSTLEIFGDGPERDLLEKLISKLDMKDKVFLMGKTSRPAKVLSDIDIFVLPSKFEGFGMVFLEAMATSRIILASNTPAAIEVLGRDGAAIFFEVGNDLDLSLKLSEVLDINLDNMRAEQSKRLELFRANVMSNCIQRVYEENSRFLLSPL